MVKLREPFKFWWATNHISVPEIWLVAHQSVERLKTVLSNYVYR